MVVFLVQHVNAEALFFIALAVFVVFLVLGILAGKGVKDAID